jgi:N-acetyl-gamma-glutamyl-phosphate reductase
MGYSIFIDGAVGTTGLEIAERLAGRSEFSLLTLPEARRKDASARAEALNASDFVILCLPDDAAIAAVGMITNTHTRVIDASTAHRVAPGWTYGFPEIVGQDAIASAPRVANPGCYPTGFIGLLAPLVRSGLLPADWPYTVNAVSGYSGGGKALIERFEADPDIAFSVPPVFAPSVIPAFRGMVVEVPLPLGAMPGARAPADLLTALKDYYAGSALVRVHEDTPDELLLRRSAPPRDGLDLYVFGAADGSQARLVATLDNLGKGASGAAVQSLNLMAGLPETAGLQL